MAQVIYKRMNPNDLDTTVMDFVEDIKENGVKYPVIAEVEDKKIKNLSFLNSGDLAKRWTICSILNMELPIIMYAKRDKTTGFDGIPLDGMNHAIEIFGEDLRNQPTYGTLQLAMKDLPYPR